MTDPSAARAPRAAARSSATRRCAQHRRGHARRASNPWLRSRSRWALNGLLLGREKVAHRAPDIVEVVDHVTAGGMGLRGDLRKKPTCLRRELPREPGGYFDVTAVAGLLSDVDERAVRLGVISHGVVPVGRVKQIDVVPPGVVSLIDDLADLVETRRGDRAARARHLEELRLRELPGLGGVRDKNRLERAVLAPQALNHPEEERLRELSVAIGHAARDIEQEEDDRMDRRLATAGELAKSQVIVGEAGRSRVLSAPLHQLFERAAPIEARARAAPIPTLARPVGLL